MRTVYLGTSPFAVTVLERLAASDHRPQLVVTRPDRPQGRGRRLQAPPVAEAARALGLPLAQPADVNAPDPRAQIAAAEPEMLIVCAFGALIKQELLDAHPILNIHPSLLPRWRGAAPIERAIMAGDAVTGVCIIELTAGLDSGPMLLRREEPIRDEDDYGTLAARLAELGAELLIDALDTRPQAHEQSEEGVTYAEKITSADRLLDTAGSAETLARIVRALHPHIGARAAVAGEREPIGVLEARVVSAAAKPGELDLSGEVPVLGCGHGGLALERLQPAGRNAMSGREFIRGRRR